MVLVIHCKFLIVLFIEQASYRFALYLFSTWPNVRAQKIRRTLAVLRTKLCLISIRHPICLGLNMMIVSDSIYLQM